MKATIFFQLSIVLSTIGTFGSSAIAQSPPQLSPQPSTTDATPTVLSTSTTLSLPTLPSTLIKPSPQPTSVAAHASALTVYFPADIRLETSNAQHQPATLFLAQDIVSQQGDLIAPVNSPVSAQLQATEGGLRIVADAIIVSGQSIPLAATSALIPSTTVTQVSGDQNGRRQAGVLRDVAGGIAGALGADMATSEQASFGGSVMGFLMGSSSPQSVDEVVIPAGTVHILTL